MAAFRFYHPIEVRYGDLDPQAHLNNARYLTFFEQARVEYVRQLGLWDGKSFVDIGIILADIHISFLAPVLFGQSVRVGVRTSRLGNKSMTMEYLLEDSGDGRELATGETVLVTFDYRLGESIPLPENWRHAIAAFEGL